MPAFITDKSRLQPRRASDGGAKYLMIEERLRHQIKSGHWKSGERLPSFTQLQREFGVTSNTVNRAINALSQNGLVECEKGRGVFVAQPRRRALRGAIGWYAPINTSEEDPYWRRLLEGMRSVAARNEIHVMMLHSQPQDAAQIMDGLLIHDENLEFASRVATNIPVVSMMVPWKDGVSVVADDAGGARDATRHLLDLGHRRIGTLMFHEIPIVRERLSGWFSALVSKGITPAADWSWKVRFLRDSGDHTIIGYDNMRCWLENGFRETGITAVFAENDRMAMGCMDALREAGLRVPEDVSVLGFDGTEVASTAHPPLTTVAVPFEEIAARATQALLSQIAGQAMHAETIALPVKVEMRGSTAPP